MEPALNVEVPALVICDNFYAAPVDVRQFALQQEFSYHPGDHKGQRTNQRHCFPGVKERLEGLLGCKITNWDKHGYNGVFQFCVGGDPIVYHADHQSYAAVVYLTPDAPPSAGTTLYRSKSTGLRTVNQQSALSKGMTLEQAQQRTFNKKLLDPTAWETVDVIGNVFNRCAIWNAQLLHAASNYFGTTKEDGRLFQMFFFDIEPTLSAARGWPQPSTRILPPVIIDTMPKTENPKPSPLEVARAAGIQPATLMNPVHPAVQALATAQPAAVERLQELVVRSKGRQSKGRQSDADVEQTSRQDPTEPPVSLCGNSLSSGRDGPPPEKNPPAVSKQITPDELMEMADKICQLMLAMTPEARAAELIRLKEENPVLHHLVRKRYSEVSKTPPTHTTTAPLSIDIPMLEPGKQYSENDIHQLIGPIVKTLLGLPPGIRAAELNRLTQVNAFLGGFITEHYPELQEPHDDTPRG